MKKDNRLIFFGTPDFSASILEALISEYPNFLVVTQPDKPVGRKQILTPSPVKILAQKHRIPVHDYTDPQEIINLLKKHQPDLAIVAAFGRILPQTIIQLPKFKTLGVHPSLLPKYRGPTPVQAAILNGDQETGVTIFLMDEKVDHGPILAQKKAKIHPSDTTTILKKRLSELGSQLLIEVLPSWFKGKIRPQPQNHQQATYTKLLTKKDGFIKWERLILATQDSSQAQQESAKIDQMIRAYTPWPGVWTKIEVKGQKKRLKILKVGLKKGKLTLDQVQLEGKKPISWKEFCRGHPRLFSPHFSS